MSRCGQHHFNISQNQHFPGRSSDHGTGRHTKTLVDTVTVCVDWPYWSSCHTCFPGSVDSGRSPAYWNILHTSL